MDFCLGNFRFAGMKSLCPSGTVKPELPPSRSVTLLTWQHFGHLCQKWASAAKRNPGYKLHLPSGTLQSCGRQRWVVRADGTSHCDKSAKKGWLLTIEFIFNLKRDALSHHALGRGAKEKLWSQIVCRHGYSFLYISHLQDIQFKKWIWIK